MKIQALVLTLLGCALAVWAISRNGGNGGDDPQGRALPGKVGARHEGRSISSSEDSPSKRRLAGDARSGTQAPGAGGAQESFSPVPRAAIAEEDTTFQPMADGKPQAPGPVPPRDQLPSHLPQEQRERLAVLLESAAATPDTADDRAAMREAHRARVATRSSDPEADFSPLN